MLTTKRAITFSLKGGRLQTLNRRRIYYIIFILTHALIFLLPAIFKIKLKLLFILGLINGRN